METQNALLFVSVLFFEHTGVSACLPGYIPEPRRKAARRSTGNLWG
jgi:hypothetical protein